MPDFFISYTGKDRAWAEWIAWVLEEAGYSVIIQAWDFRPGGNFVLDMQRATEATRTIAVLSDFYLSKPFPQSEWAAAFAQDPTSAGRKLLPIRVEDCQPTGLLAQIVHIDVFDCVATEAQSRLLSAVTEGRMKPVQPPAFPGKTPDRVTSDPVPFPGQANAPTRRPSTPATPTTPTPTTILLLSASPRGQYPLRLDEERREIEAGLIERSQQREQFRLVKRDAVRPRDLQRAMLDVKPQIVHFSGHGSGASGLFFKDETGQPKLVDGAALTGLFALFADQLQCVVLNACYSEVQARAIAQHISYVIGMSESIGDRAAIEFAVGFYDALGAGRDLEFAFHLGCNAIRLAGIAAHLTPVLLRQGDGAAVVPATVPETTTPPAPRTSNATTQQTLSLSAYDAETWVGRDGLIADLTQKLESGYRLLALTGLTGIGKTALAERLVVGVQSRGLPFHRLNFDNRGQGRDFLSGALALLPKLGEVVTTADQQDPQNALNHLLHTLRNKPFLVQIDSVELLLEGDEERGWSAFRDDMWLAFLQQLLAGEACQSQLILTTQAVPEALVIVGERYPRCWQVQAVGGLSEAEQLQLFEKNGLQPDADGIETLKRIGKLYDGHPLVLQVIAKDILDKPFNGNVVQYWQRYQSEFAEVERDRTRGHSPRSLQLRVKQRVEQSLQRLPTDAHQMLCRSAVYRRPVPESFWLAMLWDEPEERQWKALDVLKSHSLVEEELMGDGRLLLRQHNLVRGVARRLLRAGLEEWQAAQRVAASVWLADYEPEPDAPNLESVRGQLEAFHHNCEVEDWAAAKGILLDQGVGLQLQTWSYYREVMPLYQRLLGKFGAAVDVVCEKSIGNAYRNLGNYLQAIEHYQQSLETAREVGDRDGEGRALGNLGNAYYSQGNYPKAIEYQQQQLTIARELGDRQGEGAALGNLGLAYKNLGDYPKAIEYQQQQLTIAHEIGHRRGEGAALGNLGIAYYRLSDYAQAIEYHQRYLTIAREIGNRQGEGIALVNWGAALLKLEQYPEAQSHLQTALDIFKALGDRTNEAEALLRLGELHHQTGHPDQAFSYATQAHTLATELGIPLVQECETFLATLQADEGDGSA